MKIFNREEFVIIVILRLFRLLAWFPLAKNEMELHYYYQAQFERLMYVQFTSCAQWLDVVIKCEFLAGHLKQKYRQLATDNF